jgi:hypothetical protein
MHRMDNGQADETINSDSQAMTVTEMNTNFRYADLADVRNSRLEEAAHRLRALDSARSFANDAACELYDKGFDRYP